MVLQIVPRSEWAETPPSSVYPVESPVSNVFTTFTYTQMCSTSERCKWILQLLQSRHSMAKQNDIKFSFLVGGNGKVYEGRGWNVQPSLPYGYFDLNKNSVFIALIGTFNHFDPPHLMKLAVQELIDYGLENNYIIKDYYFGKLHDSK